MSVPIWWFAAAVPLLMSLGYLAGEIVAYLTTKELKAAWELLGLRVQDFLAKCNSGDEFFHSAELAAMRDAIQMLKDLNELPENASAGRGARLGAG